MSESSSPLQPPVQILPRPLSLLRQARHALIFGAASGVLGASSIALGHARGAFTPVSGEAQWFVFGGAFLAVISTCLAILRWRDRALGGSMRFAQAASVGLMVGLFNAAVVGFGCWIYAAYIDPDILPALKASAAQQREAALVANPTASLPPLRDITPGDVGRGWFVFFLLLGLVIALTSALILRKRRLR